jgi:hypothetical protein
LGEGKSWTSKVYPPLAIILWPLEQVYVKSIDDEFTSAATSSYYEKSVYSKNISLAARITLLPLAGILLSSYYL